MIGYSRTGEYDARDDEPTLADAMFDDYEPAFAEDADPAWIDSDDLDVDDDEVSE